MSLYFPGYQLADPDYCVAKLIRQLKELRDRHDLRENPDGKLSPSCAFETRQKHETDP